MASTMKTTGRVTAVAALVAALTTPGAAQELVLGGQVRPRFERKTPMSSATTDFTSMRVRMRIEGELEGSVRVVLKLQDIRLWGEDTSTLGDFRADNLDLYQGYFDYAPNEAFSLRVNRTVRRSRSALTLIGRDSGRHSWSYLMTNVVS